MNSDSRRPFSRQRVEEPAKSPQQYLSPIETPAGLHGVRLCRGSSSGTPSFELSIASLATIKAKAVRFFGDTTHQCLVGRAGRPGGWRTPG